MLTIASSVVDTFQLKTSGRVSVSVLISAFNFSVLSLFHFVSFFPTKNKKTFYRQETLN